MRVLKAILMTLLLATGATGVRAEVTLMMVEEDGCVWCERWDEEIAEIYPKTPEGTAAPLVRQDLHAALPQGVHLDRNVVYTPTFVLLRDGDEVGRIEGYPGEDFFWALLGMMLRQADIDFQKDKAG